ncbi:MAG: arginine--tRNA ligase [Candidatus Bathyarchaeia archaeon]|nr:arginine--tRNA ligase [Candidatus Bathyarchaeota archaeon A05DMB-4]MDH7595471.1 arginine--tRNA ligase [Candidatus Bathyarchaeota archaeon]
MTSTNPFGEFRNECGAALRDALAKVKHLPQPSLLSLNPPPSVEFGELASSLCFDLAKQTGKKPFELAEKIAKMIDVSEYSLIVSVKAVGGYINFYADFPKFAALTLGSIKELDEKYGFVEIEKPYTFIVEHTSVNPIHPITIGQARNPVLGDTIARLLRARGHSVKRHYYIDDVGRQSAVIAYGYLKLGKPKPKGKPDHFIGIIYTATSCITEIQRLKKQLENTTKTNTPTEEKQKIQKQLDEWIDVAAEMEDKHPELFRKLREEISKDEDPESVINELNRAYEAGEPKTKTLIREVCELVLEGFKESLSRMGIFYDSWDWESSFSWSNEVSNVIEALKKTPYVYSEKDVLEFDAEKVAKDFELKKKLGLRDDYKVPSLTLVRADGTTLYTTRDVAYSLWKFKKAQKVINVVGMEQTLAQMQLKLALYALKHGDYAENLTHFAYNLVTLPGYKMSSRKGHYITFDEVMDEATKRAYEEVSKRSPDLSEDEKQKISKTVGLGAVRYSLAEVDPTKPVVFTWDRVLNFEKNSAPYLQYSHARACSILRKAAKPTIKPNFALLVDPIERETVLSLSRFPETFIDAADNLKPHSIADYANALSDKFNTFYAKLPVIKAKPEPLSTARLVLVEAVRVVLRNALIILGIEAPEKM